MFDAALINPASRYANEDHESLLADSIEELAGLRFSIVLTAKWEAMASNDQDVERRNDLRAELENLRRQYSQKIDDIAITFGIQNAIDAQEEVERAVAIPLDMDMRATPSEDEDICI
jgi:hypothetical protein